VAWSKSAIFRAWLECALRPTQQFSGGWNLPPAGGLARGDFRCSVWSNVVTPDEAAPVALTGYSSGEWAPGGGREITSGSGWPGGGPILAGHGTAGGFASAAGAITFGADNTVSDGPVTMAGIFGDMVFHAGQPVGPGVAQYQGLAFHYYGGEAGVLDGTFTVVWPPQRVAQIRLSF
jgi:hypothetical protein